MKQAIKIYLLGLGLMIFCFSCKKDWLEAKPKKSLVIPSSIKDYQALLEQTASGFNDRQGSLIEHASGDFYVTDSILNATTPIERNTYSWAPDMYGGGNNYIEWSEPYGRILYTNVVLEGIEKIQPINGSELLEWNQVKGSALFFRAYRHYDVAKQFCVTYDKSTANTDIGIPLRLQSDFNIISVRSSVEQTYEQIISDLYLAAELLPISTPINDIYKCRPTKAAANAMLARVYLAMNEYDSAFLYANKTLQLYSSLMDYNLPPVSVSSNTPFPRFNPEVIFHIRTNAWGLFSISRLIVDSILFKSYDINDLRRTGFFRVVAGNNTFKGSYDASATFFGGLATDEIYLIRAECNARRGNLTGAMKDLNDLLRTRWKKVNNVTTYIDQFALDANDAIQKILRERRKELCFRGTRWTDLRRLNKQPQFATVINKKINSQSYDLLPNSLLYVFLIPPVVIDLSGMPQNPR